MGSSQEEVRFMEAAWRRRFRAPGITVPEWGLREPDHLVYRSNAGGKWEVYAWDRNTDAHRQVTDRPEGTGHPRIDRDGRRIWWLDDERGGELGRWIVEPFEGGSSRPAVPELPAAYPAGLALGRELAIVGSAGGGSFRVHLVRPGKAPLELYEHPRTARLGDLSADEELFLLSHSEHGDSRNHALRVLDLEGRTVAELWDGPGKGLYPGEWCPVPGDRRVLVGHERAGPIRLLVWHPEDGEVRELTIDVPGEILGASWYKDGSALLLEHYWQGRGELYRYELRSGTAERLEIGRGVVSSAQVRPDGEIWYGFSSSATPPEVRTGARTLLRPPGESAPEGVAYQDLRVGEVHAFLAEPPGPRPHPTVFRVHGGPEGMDADGFSPAVQAWVDHGFAVVMVNYRGSFGYGKAWREAILANPGFQELEDIARVQQRIVAEGIGDPSRMVLAGGSWGGYLTLLGAGTQPERWALGIASVPLADLAHAYQDAAEPLKEYDRALLGGTPAEAPERYRERSPITYAADVRFPLLILAGRNDPRCPIRQVQSYVARLDELGKRHEYYEYDAGHGSLVIEEQIRQMELALDFAARHLGTPKPL